jgi:hypothetical protein
MTVQSPILKCTLVAFYNSLPSDMAHGVLDDMHRPDVAYFNEEGDTAAGSGESRRNSRRASTAD